MKSRAAQRSTKPQHCAVAWRRVVYPAGAALLAAGCFVKLGSPIPEEEAGTGPFPTSSGTPDASTTIPVPSSTEAGTMYDDLPSDDSMPTDGSPDDTPDDSDDLSDDAFPAPTEAGPNPTVPTEAGCAPGLVPCDGGCVGFGECTPPPPPCEETCVLDNAQSACVADTCTLVECEAGWVDCDGLLENGCEMEFGTSISSQTPLPIERRSILNEDDWLGIPVYPLLQPCGNCGISHPGVPDQVAIYAGEAPPEDMMASISMAWDESGIWLRTVIFDDEWVEGIIPSDGSGSEPDPRLYDHIEFVFDGVNLTNWGEPQDHHLFIGIDTDTFDQREPPDTLDQRVDVNLATVGACRVITTKLSDVYLGNAQGRFVEAGAVYGFAISYDDYDYNDDDPTELERQHHLFYRSPGEDYVFGPRQLPELTLSD